MTEQKTINGRKVKGELKKIFLRAAYVKYLDGYIYGDTEERFPDGLEIHTSNVVSIEVVDGDFYAVTLNSAYKLNRDDVYRLTDSVNFHFAALAAKAVEQESGVERLTILVGDSGFFQNAVESLAGTEFAYSAESLDMGDFPGCRKLRCGNTIYVERRQED